MGDVFGWQPGLVWPYEEIHMRSFLKWGLIAFLGLAVLGALFGDEERAGQTREVSASASTASTPEATPPKASIEP